MLVWIDADACPKPIKDILFRASQNRGLSLRLVANRALSTPPSPRIETIVVSQGFDVADSYIAQNVQPKDIVITADLPLAAEVVEKGAYALNPRGELYTKENVRERLSIRDFLSDLRDTGIQTGGPAPFGEAQKRAFASAFDRLLSCLQRGEEPF